MPTRLPACLQKALCFFVLFSIARLSQAQCPATLNRLEPVSLAPAQWVAGGFIKGYYRMMPTDYSTNTIQKYPLIIYYHGSQAGGSGSATDLCKLISDQPSSLPGRIQDGSFPGSMTINGVAQQILVLMPQYTSYSETGYGGNMEAFIDYAVANYRVDPTRIYMTGMSSGANLVMDYASSSVARAQRLAGIALSSLCWNPSFAPNGPANIAAGGLPVWMVHCESDNPCVVGWPDTWNANLLAAGAQNIRYSRLGQTPNPLPHWPWLEKDEVMYCRPFPHLTWYALYSQEFTHAGGPNMLNWFAQNARTTLPLHLKQFMAKLVDQHVQLNWTTFQEVGNASFTIERAGADGRYTAIANIPAATKDAMEHDYQYIDVKPLAQLSYYRLSQTDIDGRKAILGTKTILNREGNAQLLMLGANPFTTQLTAFINTTRAQRITLELVDHNGRKLSGTTALYPSGVTEANIPTVHLPAGVYFIRVRSDLKTETHKVIKQ
ncbi:T9SS type A sorting domain-containing protein [Paraflavitalea pollutisoli]|uniref:T9SS type A sorting domain-containing protein n=1 Tax=Paraflavitalea pollutisoli TaxID=3034143 RepID=UPI0023ECE1B0|nr:T9SS type A sorting domain-containing protein [Paraflavitalea sp. H1-2-19X]